MPATMDIRDVVETYGGEQAIEVRLRRFQEDVQYLHGIKQELLRKYLDQWVAVYERSIVAHAKTLPVLRKSLIQKGIQQNEAVIDYIASKRRVMLL